MNIKQVLAIAVAILGVVGASSTQLDIIIGVGATKIVTAVDTLLMSTVASVLAVLTGQNNLIKDVQAMPGVESIVVNKNANAALAAMALDPTQAKVDIKPGAENAVNATAVSGG